MGDKEMVNVSEHAALLGDRDIITAERGEDGASDTGCFKKYREMVEPEKKQILMRVNYEELAFLYRPRFCMKKEVLEQITLQEMQKPLWYQVESDFISIH